jgi:divalent metal cation (Fe/Co/Zn/Cd) transporter
VIAIVLAVEMKSLLIGESATPEDQREIARAITESPEVASLIHLRTLHLGPEELLVAAKIEFLVPDTPALARAIDAVEARVRAAVPTAAVIYLEPDLDRSRT